MVKGCRAGLGLICGILAIFFVTLLGFILYCILFLSQKECLLIAFSIFEMFKASSNVKGHKLGSNFRNLE